VANPLIGRESLVFSRAGLFAVSSRLYGLFEPLRIAIFANNLAWGQHNLRLFGQIALLSGFGSERMVRCAARSFKKAAAAQTYIVKIPAAVLLNWWELLVRAEQIKHAMA